jgi:hypothetical protein
MRTEDEILDDYKYDCTNPNKKIAEHFKEELLKGDLNNYYVDQAGVNRAYFGDRCVSSVYLPLGLKRIESWFIREILRWNNHNYIKKDGYTKEELTKFIKGNIHLHNVIKTNLLYNLNNR